VKRLSRETNHDYSQRRRGTMDIMYDLLYSARRPTVKTKIMTGGGVAFASFKDRFILLRKKGLIKMVDVSSHRQTRDLYVITEKSKLFLSLMDKALSLVEN